MQPEAVGRCRPDEYPTFECGHPERLSLPAIGCTLALAEIYDKVDQGRAAAAG